MLYTIKNFKKSIIVYNITVFYFLIKVSGPFHGGGEWRGMVTFSCFVVRGHRVHPLGGKQQLSVSLFLERKETKTPFEGVIFLVSKGKR